VTFGKEKVIQNSKNRLSPMKKRDLFQNLVSLPHSISQNVDGKKFLKMKNDQTDACYKSNAVTIGISQPLSSFPILHQI